MAVLKRIIENDVDWIHGWLCGRFGVDLKVSMVKKWLQSILDSKFERWTDDDTWAMWFKNRIEFDVGCGSVGQRVTTATLHIFFLRLEETDEMISRLKNEAKQEAAQFATSKIERTNLAKIKPINRVADLVLHD